MSWRDLTCSENTETHSELFPPYSTGTNSRTKGIRHVVMRFGSAWNNRLIFFHEIWKCLNIIHRAVTWWLCNLWPLATADLCIKYTVGTQSVLQNFLQIYQAGHAQACTRRKTEQACTQEARRSKHLHGAATLPTQVDQCSYFRMRGPV
jgi:hypothetical protein